MRALRMHVDEKMAEVADICVTLEHAAAGRALASPWLLKRAASELRILKMVVLAYSMEPEESVVIELGDDGETTVTLGREEQRIEALRSALQEIYHAPGHVPGSITNIALAALATDDKRHAS